MPSTEPSAHLRQRQNGFWRYGTAPAQAAAAMFRENQRLANQRPRVERFAPQHCLQQIDDVDDASKIFLFIFTRRPDAYAGSFPAGADFPLSGALRSIYFRYRDATSYDALPTVRWLRFSTRSIIHLRSCG